VPGLVDLVQPLLAAGQDILLAGLVGCTLMAGATAALQGKRLLRLQRRFLWGLLWLQLAFLFNGAYRMAEPTGWWPWLDAVRLTVLHTMFGTTVTLSALWSVSWLVAGWMMAGRRRSVPPADASAGRSPGHGVAVFFLLLLSYTRAATGHAADHGLFSLAAGVHAVHILAAGAWAGPVWVSRLLHPGWGDLTPSEASAQAHRLSRAATVAVPLLILTGLLDGWRTLGPAAHWGSTAYAWILLVKVGLMVLAIALGLRNRWFWMPRLAAGDSVAGHGFVRILAIEAFVLLGVMTLAGLLGQSMLPA